MNELVRAIKTLAATIANTLEGMFEWLTERAYRVAAYFTAATLINIVGLIMDFSWLWLATTIALSTFGTYLTYVAVLDERDMRARVEEALGEVDFNDTSRWIRPEDPNYPKRPQR